MGLQYYTQNMSEIPLKYQKKMLFYTKYIHPTLICRGTDARKIFTQYSGISLGVFSLDHREIKSLVSR